MALEIDMLSICDADAIVVRTTEGTDEHVILIDAGNKSDSRIKKGDPQTITDHICKYTNRKDRIDLLIITHPHNDHIGGVPEILDLLCVDEILIHEPDIYRKALASNKAFFHADNLDDAQKSITYLSNVIAQIDSKGIPRSQPFSDRTESISLLDGAELTILGPTESFYEQQVQSMKSVDSIRVSEGDCEIIDAEDDNSPFNKSSVICLIRHGGLKYLFTADAGPSALENAKERAKGQLKDVHWMQIPHHGSKYNITCELIEYFAPTLAYVSAEGSHANRPNAAVVRAYKDFPGKDRGSKVYGTNKTRSLWVYSAGAQERCNYCPLTESDELDRDGK